MVYRPKGPVGQAVRMGGRGQLERLWGLVDSAKGPVGQDVGIGLQNEGASWTGCGDWLTVRRGQWELAESEGASWAGCSGGLEDRAKGPVELAVGTG